MVLKQRIITAAVLLILLYIVFYQLPIQYFSWVIGGVVLLAAWEWAALSGLNHPILRIGYLLLFILFNFMLNQLPVQEAIKTMSGTAVIWWMWSIIWLLRYQRAVQIFKRNTFVFSMLGLLILLPFWFALVMLNFEQHLNPQAGQILLLVILLVAIADTAAYFFGKSFGRHKLASRISPGKSWEGLLGAGMIVTVLVNPLAKLLQVQTFSYLELVGLGLLTVIAGVCGDLFESLIKRIAGVKDSGKILPGHGGILDRIDAYTAAVPIFMAVYFYFIYSI